MPGREVAPCLGGVMKLSYFYVLTRVLISAAVAAVEGLSFAQAGLTLGLVDKKESYIKIPCILSNYSPLQMVVY